MPATAPSSGMATGSPAVNGQRAGLADNRGTPGASPGRAGLVPPYGPPVAHDGPPSPSPMAGGRMGVPQARGVSQPGASPSSLGSSQSRGGQPIPSPSKPHDIGSSAVYPVGAATGAAAGAAAATTLRRRDVPSSTDDFSRKASNGELPAASSPWIAPGIEKVADRVPTPASEAVAVTDQHAAYQPTEEEKRAGVERELRGEEPAGTVVDGIEDDQLWVLLRRFNQQVNHVLHPARNVPMGQPDLRHTNLPNVPYRSDTLKANLERVSIGAAPPTTRGLQELVRMSDWDHEFKRTAIFCSAYFISWIFGRTLMVVTAFFVVLICFPFTRRLIFPNVAPWREPHPVVHTQSVTATAVDDRTLQTVPSAPTTLTRPEQAEEASVEVTAIVTGFASALLFGNKEEGNAVVGPKDMIEDWDDPELIVRDGKGSFMGYKTSRFDTEAQIVEVDGEKIPIRLKRTTEKKIENDMERKRDELVTWMAKTTETVLGNIADFIEIFQKALSPPEIYPDNYARFKLAAVLAVPAVALHYTPAQYVARGITFGFGAVFWGRKWIRIGIRKIIKWYPHWKQIIDPRNSILSGVPTDAQLTLHLLRVSEIEGDPLPAPPVEPTLEATKDAIKEVTDDNAIKKDAAARTGSEDSSGPRKAAKRTRGKTKGAFKKVAKKLAGMGSDVAVVGEERKLRGKIDGLVLKAKWGDDVPEGGYAAKLDGSSGHLFIDDQDECISWVPRFSKTPDKVWYIDDLVEMKKDGLGTSRLALAAMSGAEVASLGLTLRFAKTADDVSLEDMSEEQQMMASQFATETLSFKGVEAREELFNRLIAIGNQRWELL